MSWFVGIAFDGATRAEFARALAVARPLVPRARWEKADKAHLTLVFCAEAKPDAARIAEVAGKHLPFSLALEGGGAFERKVVWLGVGGQLDRLRALQAELTAALGIVDRHTGYSPHVTLARAKLSSEFSLDFV